MRATICRRFLSLLVPYPRLVRLVPGVEITVISLSRIMRPAPKLTCTCLIRDARNVAPCTRLAPSSTSPIMYLRNVGHGTIIYRSRLTAVRLCEIRLPSRLVSSYFAGQLQEVSNIDNCGPRSLPEYAPVYLVYFYPTALGQTSLAN